MVLIDISDCGGQFCDLTSLTELETLNTLNGENQNLYYENQKTRQEGQFLPLLSKITLEILHN